MEPSPGSRHARLSLVVLLVEAGAVLLGALAGLGMWIACMGVGVVMDVFAFPFPDRTYPYEVAWLLGSVALAALSAVSTWRWARKRDEPIRRWWQ